MALAESQTKFAVREMTGYLNDEGYYPKNCSILIYQSKKSIMKLVGFVVVLVIVIILGLLNTQLLKLSQKAGKNETKVEQPCVKCGWKCLDTVLGFKAVTGGEETGAKSIHIFVSYDLGYNNLQNLTAEVICGGNATTNATMSPKTLSPGDTTMIFINTGAPENSGRECYGKVDTVRVRAVCVDSSTGCICPDIFVECKSGYGCGF